MYLRFRLVREKIDPGYLGKLMINDYLDKLPNKRRKGHNNENILHDIVVIDFSQFLAGPLATMLLGDAGAEVIKIEKPSGDDLRRYPPKIDGWDGGVPYLWANRNKKSIKINLKSKKGIDVVKELIKKADVVVENFSKGVMERFGLSYEECKKINNNIIYCSIAAFGRKGANQNRVAFDPIIQAETGFVSMNGYPDRPGVRASSPVMDIATALFANQAILLALLNRKRTGQGMYTEVSLFSSGLWMTGWGLAQTAYTGKINPRFANTSPDTSPSGVFNTRDGSFFINSGNSSVFQKMVEDVLNRPDLAENVKYKEPVDRVLHRQELFEILGAEFEKWETASLQEKMIEVGVPFGVVRDLGMVLENEDVKGDQYVTKIEQPGRPPFMFLRRPYQFNSADTTEEMLPPKIGEHTISILKEKLNLNEEQIDELKNEDTFG